MTDSKVYVHPITVAEYFGELTSTFSPQNYSITIITRGGEQYFVANIRNEWDNAVEIVQEGTDTPMLLFKAAIEGVRVRTRMRKTVPT